MSENLNKRPAKGILKNSSSFDKQEHQPSAKRTKETKWDEMNIIATYHPPGKDYGHMKIDEPKTPYSYDVDMVDQIDGLNPEDLARRIKIAADKPPTVLAPESDDEDDEDEELTDEDKMKRKEFELKRKNHYNEFYALQLARKLLEEEEEEDDDDEEEDKDKEGAVASGTSRSSKPDTSGSH